MEGQVQVQLSLYPSLIELAWCAEPYVVVQMLGRKTIPLRGWRRASLLGSHISSSVTESSYYKFFFITQSTEASSATELSEYILQMMHLTSSLNSSDITKRYVCNYRRFSMEPQLYHDTITNRHPRRRYHFRVMLHISSWRHQGTKLISINECLSAFRMFNEKLLTLWIWWRVYSLFISILLHFINNNLSRISKYMKNWVTNIIQDISLVDGLYVLRWKIIFTGNTF